MRDLNSSIGKPRGTYYKGLDCPHCHGISTSRVIDVRDTPEGRRRRHECDKCEQRFTTYEITAEQFERLRQMNLSEGKIDNAIAALSIVKAQFNGARNGPSS